MQAIINMHVNFYLHYDVLCAKKPTSMLTANVNKYPIIIVIMFLP